MNFVFSIAKVFYNEFILASLFFVAKDTFAVGPCFALVVACC
jgi:hypothetical protein